MITTINRILQPSYSGKPVKMVVVRPYVISYFKGKIDSINLENMYLILDDCEELGNEPLTLNEDAACYIRDEKTNIVSIGDGTKFQKEDEISFDQLKPGNYVKFNYSRKYGKFIAVRIVMISKQVL